MTRRKFIHQLVKAGSAIVVGFSWLAEKTVPRKFVRAFTVKSYPGTVKPLQDVGKQSKWSG